MKHMFIVSILATLLGGCAVVPVGYRDDRGYRDSRAPSYRDQGS